MNINETPYVRDSAPLLVGGSSLQMPSAAPDQSGSQPSVSVFTGLDEKFVGLEENGLDSVGTNRVSAESGEIGAYFDSGKWLPDAVTFDQRVTVTDAYSLDVRSTGRGSLNDESPGVIEGLQASDSQFTRWNAKFPLVEESNRSASGESTFKIGAEMRFSPSQNRLGGFFEVESPDGGVSLSGGAAVPPLEALKSADGPGYFFSGNSRLGSKNGFNVNASVFGSNLTGRPEDLSAFGSIGASIPLTQDGVTLNGQLQTAIDEDLGNTPLGVVQMGWNGGSSNVGAVFPVGSGEGDNSVQVFGRFNW